MGLFDGGLFDFDGNGKITPDEAFMEFMIFNEVMNQNSDDELNDEFGDDDDDDF